MKSTSEKVIDFMLGIAVGGMALYLITSAMYELADDRITGYYEAKAQCEQNLPRNQYCDVEFIAKPKDNKE